MQAMSPAEPSALEGLRLTAGLTFQVRSAAFAENSIVNPTSETYKQNIYCA
jgi:hypothetical protein